MPVRKLSSYIDGCDDLRPLATHARRAAALDKVLVRTAPPSLAYACHVKQLRGGILVLLAESAAVAAKLKQLAPRLLAAYDETGVKITAIRVEVQVEPNAATLQARPAMRSLSAESIDNLDGLIARLEDSPLRQALERLARRHKP